MKNIIYLFSAILPFLFLSCGNDTNLDENNYSPSALVCIMTVPNNDLRSSGQETEQIPKIDTILVFSGKDLAWFNGTTCELRFNDNFLGIEFPYHTSVDLLVYSDNDSFSSFNLMLAASYMSLVYHTPVLYAEWGENGGYYIKPGYPDWDMHGMF